MILFFAFRKMKANSRPTTERTPDDHSASLLKAALIAHRYRAVSLAHTQTHNHENCEN